MHDLPPDPVSVCAGPGRDSQVNCEPEPPILTSHHALVLLPGMEPTLRSIVRDVDAAVKRVLVETYIWRADKLGRELAAALARAAARGVEVRVLYDPLGSQKTEAEFFHEMRADGIDVRAYRPASVWIKNASYGPRDHSRVVVIDDGAYTGGAAWGDEWLPRHRGGMGWHDVCVRVQGPAVEDFARVFEMRWRDATGENRVPADYATGDRYPDLEFVSDAPAGESLVYQRYRDAIRCASHRVWLENAYFFPPPALLRDLYDAAARGVDVRVITPGQSDLALIRRAARGECLSWVAGGIKLYEYTRCMLHAKFAVIDDDWCTVGTFNANPPGIGWSNEVNVFVFDPTFVARAARLFEADLRYCRPVTAESFARRTLFQQIMDRLSGDFLALIDATRPGSK